MQLGVVFLFSGRESSAAFSAERFRTDLFSRGRLEATLPSQFLISDLGGCFVSNELRDWTSVRGTGLQTAPGDFHGLTAGLENLIRVIKRVLVGTQ